MKPLTNIKKAPLEIAQLLSTNETLVKLLCNSEPTALVDSITAPNLNELISDQYINFYAPTEYGIQNFERTAMISIFIDRAQRHSVDKYMDAAIVVYFCTKTDNILLKDNKNRLLEATDCICQSLEGQKVSASGELELNSISYVFFDDFHAGYRVSFSLNDQQNRKVDF